MLLIERFDWRLLGLTALVVATAGCGSLTPGGIGEVTVTLTGDDPLSATALTAYPGYASAIAPSDHDDDDPEGQLEADFELFLQGEGGTRIHLTPDGRIEVKVDLEGVETKEVARQPVGAGRYTGLEMVFVKIEAEVDAGLIINGVPFTGPVEVDLEDEELTVTRALDLDIGDWLQALDPTSGTIDAQVFADLVTVTVR